MVSRFIDGLMPSELFYEIRREKVGRNLYYSVCSRIKKVLFCKVRKDRQWNGMPYKVLWIIANVGNIFDDWWSRLSAIETSDKFRLLCKNKFQAIRRKLRRKLWKKFILFWFYKEYLFNKQYKKYLRPIRILAWQYFTRIRNLDSRITRIYILSQQSEVTFIKHVKGCKSELLTTLHGDDTC